MIKIILYSRIRKKDNPYDEYLYNYVLFIYLEDKAYYNIISDKPFSLKKKLSKKRFEYIKKFLHLSLTKRTEDNIIEGITSKDSEWIKIIDIKYQI